MMTENWLKVATTKLVKSGISTARLDALVLLEDATGKDRSWLLAYPEFELSKIQLKKLNQQVTRRSRHEPLAYIRGKSEFYSREFIVNEHTLEPRPESETIIDLLKTLPMNEQTMIVDIGTGSGCLAISAQLEFPEAKVYGTDIDEKCIQTAMANAKIHNVSIDFRQGNLLEPIVSDLGSRNEKWSILANLPYVPDGHTINDAAMFEPKHAIFGGSDGLDLYREIFTQIKSTNNKPHYILTESLPFQHEDLENIAQKSSYSLLKVDDFIQVFGI